MRRGILGWTVLAVLALGSGCHTAVGRYFANRARDLGECVRVEVNGAVGFGAVAEGAGVVHAGLGGGVHPAFAGLGWRYGTGHAFVGVPSPRARGSCVVAVAPAGTTPDAGIALHVRVGGPDESIHGCWLLLPALFGQSAVPAGAGLSRAPMWSDRALRHPTVEWHDDGTPHDLDGVAIDRERLRAAHRWNHVHAFDVSADVFAGVVHVGVGVSLGEVADFLLGWFGLDIAGDDRGWDEP